MITQKRDNKNWDSSSLVRPPKWKFFLLYLLVKSDSCSYRVKIPLINYKTIYPPRTSTLWFLHSIIVIIFYPIVKRAETQEGTCLKNPHTHGWRGGVHSLLRKIVFPHFSGFIMIYDCNLSLCTNQCSMVNHNAIQIW